jgi:CRP-like cAMP-binding protein
MSTSNDPALLVHLRNSKLLAGLPGEALREFLPHLRYERWAKRMQVMPEFRTAKRFYLIISGRVRIDAQHPVSGRAVTLYLVSAGDGHNLITLLDGKPHRVLAETLDEVEAVSAPLDTWQTWLRTYPAMRQAVMRCAALHLRELAELVEDLALRDTSARLAHLLLRHLDDEQESNGLLHGLVHEDIARLIGSVRVVVNRLLNSFKQEGIIYTEAGQLRIADLERLMHKAELRVQTLLQAHCPPKD